MVASCAAVARARCAVENSRNAKSSNTIGENSGSTRLTSSSEIARSSSTAGPLSQSAFRFWRYAEKMM